MTSPLLATLGLSLMIPLSILTDCTRGLARLSPGFFAGAFAVLVGFQLESWEESRHAQPIRSAEGTPSASPHLGPRTDGTDKDPLERGFCLSPRS